jgi:hypothetical protein
VGETASRAMEILKGRFAKGEISDLDPDENAFVRDGLNDAPGVRVSKSWKTPDNRASEDRNNRWLAHAMALASALISVALTLDPTLKETLVEHANKR